MWIITDKQIAAIAKTIEKEAKKIADKYTSSDKSDSVQGDGANSRDEEPRNGNDTENNHSNSDNINKVETSESDNDIQNTKEDADRSIDTSKVIQSCPLASEVIAIVPTRPTASDEQLYVELQKSTRLVNERGISCSEIGNEKIRFDNNIVEVEVCTRIRLTAFTSNGKKKIDNNNIEWEVHRTDKEYLDGINYIIDASKKLEGNEVEFAIPKEWGNETVILKAVRLDLDREVSINLYVKDHIAAAFFRLDPVVKTDMDLSIDKKEGGTPIEMLFHNQGLYKEDNTHYISVSTYPDTPSYIYISGSKKGVIKLDKDEQIRDFTHPGGIQVGGGILAVGIEQYTKVPLETNQNSIICFFKIGNKNKDDYKEFDEYGELRIEQTIEKGNPNRASALAIVKKEPNWLVANRASNKVINFHKITGVEIKPDSKPIASFPDVGDFQNINLFLDEKEDLYLFGMGIESREGLRDTAVYQVYDAGFTLLSNNNQNMGFGYEEEGYFQSTQGWRLNPPPNFRDFHTPKKTISEKELPNEFFNLERLPIPYLEGIYLKYRQWRGAPVKDVVVYKYPLKVTTPESQNICRIFRIKGIDTGSPVLESVWIDKNGVLQSQPYKDGDVKNFIKFDCDISQSLIPDTDPSFHWASCLYLNTPSTENSNKGKEDGKEEFKGKFTLYAVGAGVKDKKIKTIYFEEKR